MPYTVPRVEIEQQFVAAPVFANNPLAAFIFGPNFRLFRYDQADEKAWTLLGNYDTSAGIALTSYPWLTSNPSERVDASLDSAGAYDHITPYVEDAFALYYNGTNGPGGATAVIVNGSFTSGDDVVVPISLGSNRYNTNLLQASVLLFADGVHPTNGTVWSRSTFFSARDVEVGDWVAVTGKNNAGSPADVTIFAQIAEIQTDATTGKVNILRTAQRVFDLDDANGGASTTLINPTSATAIKISLYLRKSTVMPVGFLLSTTSSTQVGVQAASNANAKLTDAALVDGSGVLKPLSISLPASGASAYVPARVYVTYRTLRTDNASQIQSLNDPELVEAELGPISPENPLAEGVYDALLNASGTSVYYMGVPSNNLSGYNVVLEQAKRTSAIYGLVPLTFDTTVIDAVKAHIATMSTAAQAKWRKAWICLDPVTVGILAGYAQVSAGVYWKMAAPAADPETGTSARMFVISPQSGTTDPAFVTKGVRIGDTVRVWSSTSTPTGTYKDYAITQVRSQNELIVGVAITDSVNQVVQIVRTYSNSEQVTALGNSTGHDRRVNAVFPAHVSTAGVAKEGFYLAAALAGLRAGSLPHRPLTNVEVLGFDDFTDSVITFTPTELDSLAAYGYWIVTQDVLGGTAYVRHQLTTDGYNSVGYDPKFSEDSLTTNVDSVSYGLQRALSPFIGKYNVNPATVALVSAGPQLLGYTVDKLGQSALFKDKIEATVTLDLPYPFNKATVTLIAP